jgi:hypothetical protein
MVVAVRAHSNISRNIFMFLQPGMERDAAAEIRQCMGSGQRPLLSRLNPREKKKATISYRGIRGVGLSRII